MTEDRMFRAGQLHLTSTLPSQKCPIYIEENNPDFHCNECDHEWELLEGK